MVNTPPTTGNAQLDRFLRSVADDLRTLAKPREGWRLSDFSADVSEVISDRRDLIDIVRAWGRIEDLEDSLADELKKHLDLYDTSLSLNEDLGGLVGTFSDIQRWWDENPALYLEDRAKISNALSKAEAALSTSQSAASASSSAVSTAINSAARVTALEGMSGLSPESPVDGQTANLVAQPETLTHNAVSGVIDEWNDTVGKNAYAPSIPLTVRSADTLGVSPSDPDAGVTITAALSALPVGASLYLPGDYTATTSIVVTKPVRILGPGKITAQHDNPLFDVQSDDVAFDGGLQLVGRQRDTYISTARGIYCIGTVDAYRKNLHIGNVKFDTFAGGAVVAKYVYNLTTSEGLEVLRSKYWGVALISCDTVKMHRPVVRDVTPLSSSNTNAYGITATHSDGHPDTDPSTFDVTIEEPLIEDVPTWVGIDTHGGSKISIIRPTIRRCHWGVSLVSGPGADGSEQRAPTDFLVDSPQIEECSGYGIGVSGAGAGLGSWEELATGVIRNPVLVRCGNPDSDMSGAIWLRSTTGLRLSGVRAMEPGSHGVCLTYNNFDFHIDDVIAVDPWSDTHTTPSVIAVRSSYNTGTIESFRGIRGAKQAVNVLAFGLRNSTASVNNSIRMGTACSVDTGLLVYEASGGKRVSLDMQASSITLGRWQSEVGFYGATPVSRPTVAAEATDSATTQSLVNELRANLVALGLMK